MDRRERLQALDHTDAETRRFVLFHESDRLLRKGNNRKQKQQAARLEAEFKAAAKESARVLGFSCFQRRIPVSVSLNIHEPETRGNPKLPPVAKAYLDALKEIAYVDDRQVEHLVVTHDAWEHPWLRGVTSSSSPRPTQAGVYVEVERLSDYTDRFDRAFRGTFFRRGSSPWKPDWSITDESRLINERRKRDKGLPGAASAEVIRLMEERKLRDGFFADIDRPGPLPKITQGIHGVVPLPNLHHFFRGRSGAMMMLPLRGHGPGSGTPWQERLNAALDQFAATRPGLPLEGFVALDIAVRGEAVDGKDLDNLAHLLLVPIEERLCVARGTVVAYRAYTAPGKCEGIQLRIIDHSRLLQLDATLSEIETDPPLLLRLERWAENQRLKETRDHPN